MAQRVVLTHGNPNLSYRSAALPVEDGMESVHDVACESVTTDLPAPRFPGWMRLAIIGSGAVASWAVVAAAAGWLR
ncbi:MAG: hypothetical protein U1E64_11260 [Sphingomonadaceae bacterium]|jgi:hypothetical protein